MSSPRTADIVWDMVTSLVEEINEIASRRSVRSGSEISIVAPNPRVEFNVEVRDISVEWYHRDENQSRRHSTINVATPVRSHEYLVPDAVVPIMMT